MTKKSVQEPFVLCNLEVKPGERCHGSLELPGVPFRLPVTILHGKNPGKTMLITAGIHSAEYVGIQTAIELGNYLEPERINGTIIIVKVANRPAFELRKGSLGLEDDKNLNFVFPGKEDGTATERLAWAIANVLHTAADYYIDLHCGDDYEQLTPYVYYAGAASEEVCRISRQMAKQVDVPYMVKSHLSTGGSYNYAASIGVPGILIERGGVGVWSEEEVHSMRRDVFNILCHLEIYNGVKGYRSYYPMDVEDVCYQVASHRGCWYPQKKAGDLVKFGEKLGEVRDYRGNSIEICRAEFDGVILYQTVSLQVLAGGPMIAYGKIVKKQDDRKDRIVHYWGKRSESFREQKKAELHSKMAERWSKEMNRHIPSDRTLKILDVGCGSGFFSILLAKEGYDVIGTDLTPEMIEHSNVLAAEEGVSCQFMIMDAENLEFADDTFDVVVSRNLTWTLPHAEQAYKEWIRVLKPGGILLNFDANYGESAFASKKDLPELHVHNILSDAMLRECDEIKKQLPISLYERPAWDLKILGQLGLEEFRVDLGLSKRIYTEKDEFYNPTPMFLLCGKKGI